MTGQACSALFPDFPSVAETGLTGYGATVARRIR
jgi:hypothetical protein